jgi:hypothetical protein
LEQHAITTGLMTIQRELRLWERRSGRLISTRDVN